MSAEISPASGHRHLSHPALVRRLKRACGQLAGVAGMIEAGRPCLDVAQQLHAVENALAQARRTLIRDHLDHCLNDVVGELPDAQKAAVDAFRDITRYL
jgi:DNA-binding FrmR family transcriptional regulator